MVSTAKKTSRKNDAPAVGQLVLAASRGRGVADAAEAVYGRRCVATLDDVAREFGVSPNTVKQSWRSNGMPGEGGKWPLADILLWRLEYEAGLAAKRGNLSSASEREIERRQLEAETRKLELQADRLEREEQTAMGNLVPADSVVQMVSGLVAAHVKQLQQIADDLAPMFPQDKAAEYVRSIRLQVERRCTAFAESMARDVLKGAE